MKGGQCVRLSCYKGEKYEEENDDCDSEYFCSICNCTIYKG